MVSPLERIEEYVGHAETYVSSSVSAAASDFPLAREAFSRFWADVNRLWPSTAAEVKEKLSGFTFEARPPPPPPSRPWPTQAGDWIHSHPYQAVSIGLGVVGAGLLAGYSTFYAKRNARLTKIRSSMIAERRQVVVVLGGDLPLGRSLVLELENQGYIVIASASTPEAAADLERASHGFLRALVLDPLEPLTVPLFVRSLGSALSRRFPLNASGDPHVSASSQPFVHSVISLLSIDTSLASHPVSIEQLSLEDAYLPYLTATHTTPLQAIQMLLPILRASSGREKARERNFYTIAGSKTIIFCVPATDARVGLPYAAAKAMSAAATLRGAEVLRRELKVAVSLDDSYSPDTRVVVVDVGAIRAPTYTAISQEVDVGRQSRIARKPSDARKFAKTLVDVVNGGTNRRSTVFSPRNLIGVIRNWLRGERFALGAGAGTYALASHLPITILDLLINLPHFLVGIRNALLPVPPRAVMPAPEGDAALAASTAAVSSHTQELSHESSDQEQHDHPSGSEADVESNNGHDLEPAMGESWVSLSGQVSDL